MLITGGRCVCLGVAASSQFVVRAMSCCLFLSQEVSEVVVGDKCPIHVFPQL